ncbi:MAG: glycosyltransferase [Bacteroidia bacterium]
MNQKDSKTLFLFTKTYPFGNGEQYITTELPYLAAKFAKIIIYPNDYYGDEITHSKKLPDNAVVLNFNLQLPKQSNNKLSDYLYLLKTTFQELILTDDKKYFFKNFKWNLINFWTQFQISKSFSNYLNENNFNEANTVFYSYWFHKSAILLSILKDKKQISKFVSRAHSIDLYHNKWGIINDEAKVPPYKLFKLKHISQLLTISGHGAEFIKNNFPKYEYKVKTFFLGINNINQQPLQKEVFPFFLIVTCSHLDNCKRLDSLAEAIAKLQLAIKWVHFGGGDKNEETKILKHLSAKPNNIKVELKGYISNDNVHLFYRNNNVNLFVNLSKVEGIPVSIMEAMAYEIPILATQIYGVPEAVIENKNGFLLNENFTIDELVQKLNYCLTNEEQLKKMGKKSREIYLEKFSAEKNYTQFAEYLLNL